MEQYKLKNPVAIIIFNRYDSAHKVLMQIKKAQPEKLYIIADGPRDNKPGEKEKCLKARSIADEVDWDCSVQKIFSDKNLGCAKRVTSGLSELFSKEEAALIFEDDCIPSMSFFEFADQMLERYKDNEKIMLVSASNKCFVPGAKNAGGNIKSASEDRSESYFFSNQVQIWGWATWRRAWNKMDLKMKDWPLLKKQKIVNRFYKKASHRYYWNSSFDYVYNKHTNSWAFPWVLSVWKSGGLSVVPKVNMVKNAGFDADATHTSGKSIFERLEAKELSFPLVHPQKIEADSHMDLIEMKSRIKDAKQLPYPFNMFASKAKWFLIGLLNSFKSFRR